MPAHKSWQIGVMVIVIPGDFSWTVNVSPCGLSAGLGQGIVGECANFVDRSVD